MKPHSNTEEDRQRRKREFFLIVFCLIVIAALARFEYHLAHEKGPLSTNAYIAVFILLNFNIILVLLVGYLTIRNIVKILFEDQTKFLGARLRSKLTLAFIFMALVPTMFLFLVSWQFLKASLSFWFDVRIAQSMEGAIHIGQMYYDERLDLLKKNLRQTTNLITIKCIHAGKLDLTCIEENLTDSEWMPVASVLQHTQCFSVHSVEIFLNNQRIFLKKQLPLVDNPPPLPDQVMTRATDTNEVIIHSDEDRNNSLTRAVYCIKKDSSQAQEKPFADAANRMDFQGHTQERRLYPDAELPVIVAVGYLMPHDINHTLHLIRVGYEDYEQFLSYKTPIAMSALIALFLVTLTIVFVAVWFGMRMAKGITEPVQMLADATHKIAQGDLEFSLEPAGRDELSALVRAFNVMTKDLKEAKNKVEKSSLELLHTNSELESRRQHMETILQNITTGVISLDRKGRITTINRAAEEILGLESASIIGKTYTEILGKEQQEEFEGIKNELFHPVKTTVQRTMRIAVGGRLKSLFVSFTLLKDRDAVVHGLVIVFDDLTELERAERMAAWREVARRIAHEVKNPLTPIQLCAQRLRRRHLDSLDDDARRVFDSCTNTIIDQVDGLKKLVNEFSTFARMPALDIKLSDLEKTTSDVLEMYAEINPKIKFELKAQPQLPQILCDPEQIKRALINLVDNAVSSMPSGGVLEITISAGQEGMRLSVADTGAGIAGEDKDRIFEPYFTRKPSGTGLGLAIVKSIVDEHHGSITVTDNTPAGTVFTIILPMQVASI